MLLLHGGTSSIIVLLLVFLCSVTDAARISGTVLANSTLEIGAVAELTAPNASSTGQFNFVDVPAGEYGLNIRSQLFTFQTYAVSVSDQDEVTASVYIIGRGAIPGTKLTTPLRIPAVAAKVYGDQTPPFSLVRLAKSNPTILMLVIGGLAAVALPALLQMLDPEIAQEVQQNQREMHNKLANFQSMDGISKMLSSGSTGTGTGTGAAVGAGTGTGSGTASPGGKAKKRRK